MMRAARTKRAAGFTLSEVVVVVGLVGVLTSAIAYVYVEYGRAAPYLEASLAVTEGGSAIIDEVREAGLQATRFVGSHDFFGTVYTASATTTIFELPAVTAWGSTIAGSYDYIGIYVSDTEVYRAIDAAGASARVSGTRKLTEVLEELLFTYNNASIPLATNVIVAATTSTTVYGEVVDAYVRTHVYLRNL